MVSRFVAVECIDDDGGTAKRRESEQLMLLKGVQPAGDTGPPLLAILQRHMNVPNSTDD